jgi:hypothetical protein
VDDHLCVVVVSHPDEPAEGFNRRLVSFWSHLLRTCPDQYEGVYAESARPEIRGTRLQREYLVSAGIIARLELEMKLMGLDFEPIDVDDVYSKFEASAPDWFLVPH